MAFFSCIVGDMGERDERRGERCTMTVVAKQIGSE